MAVTLNPMTQIGMTVVASWSSTLTDPTYYVYINGELASVQTETTYSLSVAPDENIFIEVFDSSSHTAASIPSGRLTLCWYRDANADYYRVEQYISSAWVEIATVDNDQWFYTYTTGYLADSTTAQFRIIPVGDGSAEGDAVSFSRLIVRYPDPPSVSFAYSESTTKVTISAA